MMKDIKSSSTSINNVNNEHTPLLKTNKGYVDVSYDDEERTFFYQSTDSITSITNMDDQSRVDFTKSTASRISTVSHASLLATLAEKISGDQESTLFLTICNILPILQGSGVLGIPFAVAVGGLWFLPAGLIVCILADITGLLLIECLYKVSSHSGHVKRVNSDLMDIGYACWGKYGATFVNILNLVYLTANNVVCVVLLGECIYDIIKEYVSLNQMTVTALFSILFYPPLFIRKLSLLAYISMAGVLSVVIGCFVSLIVFIQHNSHWSDNIHKLPTFDLKGFPLGIAILLYTTMLNSLLPNFEGAMKNRKQIKPALHISYVFSTVFKLTFGLLGALTFGVETNQLIAINVANFSIVAKYILTFVLCVYALTNFSLMYFVFFEQMDNAAARKNISLSSDGKYYIPWLLFSRLIGVVLCVSIALVVPYFALVAGIVGGVIGTCLVFIFPISFHLQLKWKDISLVQKLAELTLLLLGVVVGCAAIYSSISALINAIEEDQ